MWFFPHWLVFFKSYNSQNVGKSIGIEAYKCFQTYDEIIDSISFYFAIIGKCWSITIQIKSEFIIRRVDQFLNEVLFLPFYQ